MTTTRLDDLELDGDALVTGAVTAQGGSSTDPAFQGTNNGILTSTKSATPIAVANNATTNLFAIGSLNGMLVIYDDTSGGMSLWLVGKAAVILAARRTGSGIDWDPVATNPGTINVYVTGGNVQLENKSGSAASIRWHIHAV